MPWDSSTRRSTLPGNWSSIRAKVLKRDLEQCQWEKPDGNLCLDYANQCDHIGDRYDHSLTNLQSLCKWHHDRKTAGQAAAARKAKHIPIKRPAEKHPADL